MTRARWYFDFISPFSWLQHARFDRLPADLEVAHRPLLFAALLDHWEHKGPAEIPGKRRYSYRWCRWYAVRNGIGFRMPPSHPFNPLNALRLAIALDCTPAVVDRIFRFIWAEGRDINDPAAFVELCDSLGVADPAAATGDPAVRHRLRANGEEALSLGVFGVPTFAVERPDGGTELFWGEESTEMLLDWLRDPEAFDAGEMARVSDLPYGRVRKGS